MNHFIYTIVTITDNPHLFYEAVLTLIPKPDNTTHKKNDRPIFLMSKGTKFLNKIIANSIQKYIRQIIHMIK